MNFRNKIKSTKILVAALWLVLITGGVAFAGYTCPPTPGITLKASDLAAILSWFAKLAGKANAGAVIIMNYTINTTINMNNIRTAQGKVNRYKGNNSRLRAQKKIPKPKAESLMVLNQVNEDAANVLRAADDYAAVKALSIARHYEHMTKKQIVAELVEEGRSYGYIPPAKEINAKEEDGIKLLAKALAEANPDDDVDQMPILGKKALETDCSTENSRNGLGNAPGKLPEAQNRVRGNDFAAKATYGVHQLDNPNDEWTQATASDTLDVKVMDFFVNKVKEGGDLSLAMGQITGGCSPTSRANAQNNIDPFSFFIPKANAASFGGVEAARANLAQKTAKYFADNQKPGAPRYNLGPDAGIAVTPNQIKYQEQRCSMDSDCTAAKAFYLDASAVGENLNASTRGLGEYYDNQ